MHFADGIFLLGTHLELLVLADSRRGLPRTGLVDQTLDICSEFRVRGEKVTPIAIRILFLCRLSVRLRQWRFFICLSSEKICELFIAQTTIAICIDATNNSEDLCFDQVIAEGPEELLEIANVDMPFLVAVNCAIRGKCCEVGTLFETIDQGIHPAKKVDFMLDQSHKAHFHVVWQCIEAPDAAIRSPLHLSPKHIIVARQYDLDEIRVAQISVLIRVEKLDQTSAITDVACGRVIFEEVEYGASVKALLCGSIDAAEGRVWREIR